MLLHEDRFIDNLIEKQIEDFELLAVPTLLTFSSEDILERVKKDGSISGFNVFTEPKKEKNQKIVLSEKQPEDDLESYIEAKYLKGIVEPMVAFEISSVVNRGRDNAIKSIDGINIAFAQWSANMEGNPCPFCADKNGEIISVDNPDYVDCQPPVHPNCECIWVYITDQERTGNGEIIEETWNSPDDEDKLKFRMFDIYNAKDLDRLVDIFVSKSVRISEEHEKKLINKITDLKNERYKQEEIRQDILNGKYELKVNEEKQDKHISGAKKYNPDKNRSILTSDAQELINNYAGKGRIITRKKSFPKEKIVSDKTIGKYYNKRMGKFVETQWGMIIYSKTGTHIYPAKPDM